uniref:C-type lectin domain-containing protein n=1 Tax=Labrus bergylta TaxID=56723 RepID=A0A3Q3G1K8_9LABR
MCSSFSTGGSEGCAYDLEHKTLERTKRVEAATVKSPQRVPETHEDYRRIRTSGEKIPTTSQTEDTSLKMDALLLLLFTVAASGLCAESPQVKRRYFFNYDHKTQDEARAFCRDKHTDLATITSMEDVDTLSGMADLSQMWQIVDGNRAWIGLYDDVDSWSWSLSDPSFYDDGEAEFRQWAGGMPDNIGSREHCTTMYFDGLWNDVHCMDNLKSVCCDATGSNVTFVLISTDMSWTEAQSYCREHHTDLASVRNLDENQKIKELIPFLQSVWIGLSRETWKWLDGSNSSFRYWNLGFSDPNNLFSKEACVSADFGNFGKWEDWPCGYKRSYICYTAGITQQVIRVSVQKKKNPSVDLNHSAVMEHILQQLRQKLRDEGLHENIRLSWRRQPGGNVFQKEESEEKKETPEC